MASGRQIAGSVVGQIWPIILAAALALAILPVSSSKVATFAQDSPARPHGDKPVATVRLTIDYGDGVQKVFHPLAWKEGLTVLGALESASKHPRGIKLAVRGTGATAFVTAIDDLKNEGTGRNWTFAVNGKRANKSCGVWVLQASDSIVWRFGTDKD